MHKPVWIWFDLGGVLIENTVFDALQRLLPQPLDTATLRERWLRSTAVRQFELGRIPTAEFAERFVEEWGIAMAHDDFIAAFTAWPKGYYAGAREWLQRLRPSYRVACLSNSNAVHWAKLGGFESEFDLALSSHLMGEIKPDRAVFMRALDECGATPEQVVFFDDSLSNVEAAQALGIRTFHVEGFDALVRVMEAQGLLPN